MAALSQTPANVATGSTTTKTRGGLVYGESVTQGQPVFLAADGKYYRCDANDTAIKARCAGIALQPGIADSPAVIALPGSTPGESLVNLGATLAAGMVYCVGATVGEIVPYADLTTGDYVTIIGVAKTTALLDFQVLISDTQKA